MNIQQLQIKNFRCFSDLTISFNGPYTLLVGDNGTGKTSILEALYYLCYLRSFRSSSVQDLIQFDQEAFFVKACFSGNVDDSVQELQVGLSSKKRLVKLNRNAIASYKDILAYYRVVSLTEDDLWLIKGGPEVRRAYVDHALFLVDHTYVDLFKQHKIIVSNRNAILQNSVADKSSYEVWTEQLFHVACRLADLRVAWLHDVQERVNRLLQQYISADIAIQFNYVSRKNIRDTDYASFKDVHMDLYAQEMRLKRSLFGVHLDDVAITFQGKRSRQFASRGQQKMIVLLMKIAQIQLLESFEGMRLFLLDDFMTDFDEQRLRTMLAILFDLNCQLVFTVPSSGSLLESLLLGKGGECTALTICKEAP